MNLYVIYERPADLPDGYLVRRWFNTEPQETLGIAGTLEEARKFLPPGVHNLGRMPKDDLCIKEVWI